MKITNRLKRLDQGARKLLLAVFICFAATATAQTGNDAGSDNPYVKLGQKALIDGDFKTAVTHLKKVLPSDPNNVNVIYMIGYSEYQLGNYKDAAKYFSQVTEKDPDHLSAFYYSGKSKTTDAIMPDNKLSDAQRASLLNSGIQDFTRAIELDNTDLKSYQNRGIAYRDLGNLLGTPSSKNHNKAAATEAYNNCIKDLKVVVDRNPGRKDMALELKKATVYRDNLK